MDFPAVWTVLATDKYETATPRIMGDGTMEICAQLRPSGRILDNFRVAIGGTKILKYGRTWGSSSPSPSARFAVIVGEDNNPRLQMQSLPASAVLLSGKALLRG